MAKLYFACPLVVQSVGRPVWVPKIVDVLDQSGEGYDIRWKTTDAIRSRPWAVGVVNVSDAQLALVNADNNIHTVNKINVTRTFSELSGPVRTRINSFCDNIGVPRPDNNETLRDLFQRLVQVIESQTNIEDLDVLVAG